MFDANAAITRREILDLMEAARWAPNHKLTQPWRFVVFMDKGIDSLATMQIDLIQSSEMDAETIQNKIYQSVRKGKQCSTIAAIVKKRDQQQRVPEWEEMCAVAWAVQDVLPHAEIKSNWILEYRQFC
jgi:nitroreductase